MTCLVYEHVCRGLNRQPRELHSRLLMATPPSLIPGVSCKGFWRVQSPSWEIIVRKTLRDLGFGEISSIYWKMSQRWFDLVGVHKNYLDLRSKYQPVELAFHNIWTLFRFRCFEHLLNHPKPQIVTGCGILWATMNCPPAVQPHRPSDEETTQVVRNRSVVLGSFARWGGFNETDLALGLKVGALCVCLVATWRTQLPEYSHCPMVQKIRFPFRILMCGTGAAAPAWHFLQLLCSLGGSSFFFLLSLVIIVIVIVFAIAIVTIRIIISIRMEHHQHQHDRHQHHCHHPHHHCHNFNCIPSLFPSWRMYLIFSRNDRAIK